MKDDATLLYTLLKDYHETARHIKALRADQETPGLLTDELREAHRHAATGWFNAVFVLWMTGSLAMETLKAVASPRAAQLWLEYVAPLDKAIRLSRGGKAENPVETFWTEYVKKQLVAPGSSMDDAPAPEPEKVETAH